MDLSGVPNILRFIYPGLGYNRSLYNQFVGLSGHPSFRFRGPEPGDFVSNFRNCEVTSYDGKTLNLLELPENVILHILRYLDNDSRDKCLKTCKLLYELVCEVERDRFRVNISDYHVSEDYTMDPCFFISRISLKGNLFCFKLPRLTKNFFSSASLLSRPCSSR